MEPISYTLVLKSKDGYLPGGTLNNTSAATANNANLFYLVTANQIFRRMSGIPGVNMCKLEFVGMEFDVATSGNALNGIDIVVGSQYVMNTTQLTSNNAGPTERIIACVNPSLITNAGASKSTIDSSEIAYKTPLYIDNINALTFLRIYFRLALTAAKVTSAVTPSYSMELKVTPIMT